MVRHREPQHFVQRFGVRKERGRVAVVAHAEVQDVEDRTLCPFETKMSPNGRFVSRSRFFRIQFAFNADSMIRRQRNP